MKDLLKDGNKLLRNRLVENSSSLLVELENLWDAAQEKIHQFQEGKTGQGAEHCYTVENNIGVLLQYKIDNFKDIDLFILSAAAALHDIGKIRLQISGTKFDHGQWGRKLLLDKEISSNFFRENRKATAVAEIVGVHNNGQIADIPEEPFAIGPPPRVQLRSLAAIFRLADMLDTDYRRVPYLLEAIRSLRFVENPEVWIGRRSIGGWDFAKDGKSILLYVSPNSDNDLRIASACVDLLNENITESQQMYLQNCPTMYWDKGIKTETVNFPFRFQLSTKTTVDPELVRVKAKNEYLKNLCWDLSELDLDGLGEFTDKKPTKLQDVFIDVEAEFVEGTKPNWIQLEQEKLDKIHRTEKLEKRSLPRTLTQQLLEGPMPITSIIDRGQFDRIVLLGDPGSGKSTIAQYLCTKYANESIQGNDDSGLENKLRKVPFRILVRQLVAERKRTQQKYSITDYLVDEVNYHLRSKCPEGFVTSFLTTGRALVIFDGLDEVLDLYEREKIRKEIMHFVGLFPEASYIVTSRIVAYEQNMLDPEKFVHLVLLPLGEEQIDSFVEKWYPLREHDPRTCKTRINSLKKALKEPDIGQLGKNPLLLTIMALIHKAEADLPRQRVLLYDRCVQAFLVNRDKAKDLLSYDEIEICACHAYLGYQMQSKLVYAEVNADELRDMLFSFFKERWPGSSLEKQKRKVDEFTDVAERRGGIIVERIPGVFSFGHRSFQEYFAACYLTSTNYGIDEIWNATRDKIFNPPWHETIKLLGEKLGYTSSRGLDQFAQKLLCIDPSEYQARPYENIILVGEIAAERAPMNGATLLDICDKIIETAFKSSDFRAHARSLITALSEGAAREYMVKRARDILKKGTAVESNLRRTLMAIIREEEPF